MVAPTITIREPEVMEDLENMITRAEVEACREKLKHGPCCDCFDDEHAENYTPLAIAILETPEGRSLLAEVRAEGARRKGSLAWM